MPWSDAQRKLFHAAEENPEVAREHGIGRDEARKLADEADKLKKEGKETKKGIIDLRSIFYGQRRG